MSPLFLFGIVKSIEIRNDAKNIEIQTPGNFLLFHKIVNNLTINHFTAERDFYFYLELLKFKISFKLEFKVLEVVNVNY